MQSINLAAVEILSGLDQNDPKALKEVILALVMEVEALRRAMIEESKAKGIAPKDSVYGQAYRSTALLTHNAAGPSTGMSKLLNLWFSIKKSPDGIDLREALMLMRLGFSPHEIIQYAMDAEHEEMLT